MRLYSTGRKEVQTGASKDSRNEILCAFPSKCQLQEEVLAQVLGGVARKGNPS